MNRLIVLTQDDWRSFFIVVLFAIEIIAFLALYLMADRWLKKRRRRKGDILHPRLSACSILSEDARPWPE